MNDHFSIAEAAARLRITEAALLRACLDEQLELSIRFSGRNLPFAKLRRQIPMEVGYPAIRAKTAELGLYDGTITLGMDRSLWTLVIAGSGRLCVEDEYQRAIGRPIAVSDSSPSSRLGVFVSMPDTSMQEPGYVMLYELQEYRGTAPAGGIRWDEDFHSAHTLPDGSELVISREALSAFQANRSTDADEPKPVIAGDSHKPDWSAFRDFLKLTLREAVCLSCDTDPKTVALGRLENFFAQLLPLSAASKDAHSEITHRLRIARTHVGAGGTLSSVTEDKDVYVYLATFAKWALNTMKWDIPDELRALAATAQPAVMADAPTRTVRRKLKSKRHALEHVIVIAKNAASEPDSYLSVWPVMVRLAETPNPPAPLIGYVEGEGIKYQADKGVKFFTKGALRKQMEPNAR